jgi:hypothetical protein
MVETKYEEMPKNVPVAITHVNVASTVLDILDERSISSASNLNRNDCHVSDREHEEWDNSIESFSQYLVHTPASDNDALTLHETAVMSVTRRSHDDTDTLIRRQEQSATPASCDSHQMNDDENELALYCHDEDVKENNSASPEFTVETLDVLSLFDHLDILFEKLCFGAMSPDLSEDTVDIPATAAATSSSFKSMDTIIAMLGCFNPPATDELESFVSYGNFLELQLLSCCSNDTTNVHTTMIPPIQCAKRRAQRRGHAKKQRALEQLFSQRGRTSQHLYSQQSSHKLRTVRSFASGHRSIIHQQKSRVERKDDLLSSFDRMENWLLGGMPEQNFVVNAPTSTHLADDNVDGYDSDPGLTCCKPIVQRSSSPRSTIVDTSRSINWDSSKLWYDASFLNQTVEETMNSTWDLCWIHNDTPLQIQIWIERGTLIQKNSVMVEPRLMWRCSSKSTASSLPVQESIRLLQICRVREANSTVNTDQVPMMCRASTSFVIKTIRNESFWFQASTIQERDFIMDQWKVTIARLATLAVLEDTAPLLKEFFLTMDNEYV